MPVSSVERPVSALRQRMLEDMAMRGLRSHTQHDYIRFVRSFAGFLGRSPDTAQAEDIRRFQVHQREIGVQPPTINGSVSALRFFFNVTLDRPDLSRRLVLARFPRKLPAVLSVEEVGRLLEAAPGPKYRAALGTAYGAGLRVSEVAALKIGDIDSTRMLIRVEQGKGRKDRNAMLSPQLLELLRLWWREGKRRGVMLPQGWLFPGRNSAATSMPARTAGIGALPTTAAAIGIAPNARAPLRAPGWPSVKPTCCRSATSMSSSRFPPRSQTSPRRTRRSSTICCSAQRRRR
jgi:integrase/recombinase XerD